MRRAFAAFLINLFVGVISWRETSMSKPLRSRPIDLCLEENGAFLQCRVHLGEIHELLMSEQVGATFYSCVRSLRGLLIGLTLCTGTPHV